MDIRTPQRLPLHRLPVFPVLLAQLGFGLIASAVIWMLAGRVAGYSALIGLGIGWLLRPSFGRSTLARPAN